MTNDALAASEARLSSKITLFEERLAARRAQSEARLKRCTLVVGVIVIAAVTIINKVL